MNWRRLTIIVIPETDRRTRQFQLPQPAVVVIFTLVIGLLVLVGTATRTNLALVQRLKALEPLEGVTRQQRAEINEMVVRATQMQGQLDQLHAVEANIRQITAANAEMLPARSRTALEEQPTTVLTGRGGGRTFAEVEHLNPVTILSSIMPTEVTRVLFSSTPLSQQVLGQDPQGEAHAPQAKDILARMASQLETSEALRLRLSEHEKTLESHLEYLVNRPNGFPVTGGRLTDRFGWRYSPFDWGQQLHTGLDIAAPYWSAVNATAPGTVAQAGWKGGGFGYTVIVDHAFGYQTMYAHLADWDVKAGDRVERGQLLGWVGSTGASTGPHLHYEVHVDDVPVDPAKYLN